MSEAAPMNATPRWMLSFADLLSCILAFFVLLFSISAPDLAPHNELKKQQEAPQSVKKTTITNDIKFQNTDQDTPTTYLYNVMKEKIAAYPELKTLVLTPSPTQLTLSIDVATFKKSAQQINTVIRPLSNRIEIYSSDIELSAKALEILQRFDLNKKINYFEDRNLEHKIDIVIYP